MGKRRAAYLGPAGTFSHEAATRFWGSRYELIPCPTAKEVIRLYREKAADRALLAIDSSVGGTVGENLDEIARLKTVRIVGESVLSVRHQLLAGPGGSMGRIKTVLSHPKALEECEVWLSRHLPQPLRVPVRSSAAAAEQAAGDPAGETAAVASMAAADLYKLKVLAADIETSPLNATRFWILGRKTPRPTARDKTTFLVSGGLNRFLKILVETKIPILGIYERPSGGKIDSPFYFVDVAGHLRNPPLAHLRLRISEGRRLGSYPRAFG
jgi:chorismate mutase / prephenate dehydratase